jgi:hypothetical protein
VQQLPDGFAYESPPRTATSVEFLADVTWVDEGGMRHTEQQIFDEMFRVIRNARRFILLDMFLYNNFQGKTPETHRALSSELTEALVKQKTDHPDMQITLITDPINTVYGGIASPHLATLTEHDIQVVITELDLLPDSNPCYSLPWRILAKPFGSPEGRLMPNPFGEGRVSMRNWLKLLNFKANHRKVLIADADNTVVGMVTSANPHDGSSAHGNNAIRFSGRAALDLLESEMPIIRAAGKPLPEFDTTGLVVDDQSGEHTLQVITESRIKQAVLDLLNNAEAGDQIDLVMFYLSERKIISALIAARDRGTNIRILLDPNKDAFGWKKNGIPNRQVAKELAENDIAVRWCDTHGEQCHSKTLMVTKIDGSTYIISGSANFTRRNLNDLNLETDVRVTTIENSELARSVQDYINRLWHNEPGRRYSTDYEVYKNDSLLKGAVYRLQEATGLSSF